jgi:transcriptional regulator with GAF, ATPase, and Fis domain
MTDRDLWGREESTTSKRRRAELAREGVLHVIVDDKVTVHSLPTSGEVCLGRGADAHIPINAPDVSRHHAMLRMGTTVGLCDLGSANGTFFRDERLPKAQWRELESGDWFVMADCTVVLKTGAAAASPPRRSVGRATLIEALEEQLSTHRRLGQSFCVCTIRCITTQRWIDVVEAFLLDRDHLAVLGNALVGIVLVSRTPEAGQRLLEAIAAQLRLIGARPELQLKVCPRDGDRAETLLPKRKGERAKPTTVRPPAPMIRSSEVRKLYEMVDEVAPTMTNILILGETGVGKELLARAVHQGSPRRSKPFLAINCAALSENLLESELFGYERGAFTGAVSPKAGLLETAEGGTVFLDEVGEMPPSTQAKLLRVLEERKVWRLGSLKPQRIDVRIVAATNRDLQEEVEAKRFRADLYYRLNGLSFLIPPLRERVEEIKPLADHFRAGAAAAIGKAEPRFAPPVLAALERYRWPGNIRELRNAVERAVLLARDGVIELEHLPREIQSPKEAPAASREAAHDEAPSGRLSPPPTARPFMETLPAPERNDQRLHTEMERLERQLIVDALAQCHGNQTRAAELLGITRRMLAGRLERYDIPRPRASNKKK